MKLTVEEILEGNKLIAEFMGYRVFHKRYPKNHGIGAPEKEFKDCIVEKTKYHSSWDWSILVVDRINGMGKAFNLAMFKNYISLTVEKFENKFYKDFSFSHAEYITSEQTGKEAMFKLLVKFIEWHNQQVTSTNLETIK